MLTDYIRAAMTYAVYETLEDGTFYGEIPVCPGVLTNTTVEAECPEMLQDALEGWILLGLQLGQTLPVIDGIDINRHEPIQEVA